MTITRIKMCYLPADQVEPARAFYEETLGLVPKFVDGAKWIQYDLPEASFAIASREEAAGTATGPVVVFETDDLAGLERSLEQQSRIYSKRDMGSHGIVLTLEGPLGQPVQIFARQ